PGGSDAAGQATATRLRDILWRSRRQYVYSDILKDVSTHMLPSCIFATVRAGGGGCASGGSPHSFTQTLIYDKVDRVWAGTNCSALCTRADCWQCICNIVWALERPKYISFPEVSAKLA